MREPNSTGRVLKVLRLLREAYLQHWSPASWAWSPGSGGSFPPRRQRPLACRPFSLTATPLSPASLGAWGGKLRSSPTHLLLSFSIEVRVLGNDTQFFAPVADFVPTAAARLPDQWRLTCWVVRRRRRTSLECQVGCSPARCRGVRGGRGRVCPGPRWAPGCCRYPWRRCPPNGSFCGWTPTCWRSESGLCCSLTTEVAKVKEWYWLVSEKKKYLS